jgi:hypothetical protein
MDSKYIETFTDEWNELDRVGDMALFHFYDYNEWETKCCIKRGDEVIYTFDDGAHGNNKSFFAAVCEIKGVM